MSDTLFTPPAPLVTMPELSEDEQKALDVKNALREKAEQAGMNRALTYHSTPN